MKTLPLLLALWLLLFSSYQAVAQRQIQTLNHGDKDDQIVGVYFTSDGKRLVSAGGYDSITMWDLQTARKVWQLRFETGDNKNDYYVSNTSKMCLSPDDKILALIQDHFHVVNDRLKEQEYRITLVDAQQGKEWKVIEKYQEPIWAIAFARNGQLLAWGGNNNETLVWDLQKQKIVARFQVPERVMRIAFSPDGQILAVGTAQGLALFNIKSQETVRKSPGVARPISDVTFSPDGSLLVVAPGDMPPEILVWRTNTWERVQVLKDANVPADRLAFSPDGRRLASTFGIIERGVLFVWRVGSRDTPYSRRFGTGVWSLDFAPDGNRLAVRTENGKICILKFR